ncbi:MAG: exodeoxyribonuclease V subunit alpha [Desulfobacteraceae bacterium]|nr:exodeoxyribonuclease V subunit alpha [Desulfobacteraceae bacterium]
MKKEEINQYYDSGIFSYLDIHFAGFIADIAKTANESDVFLAAALVSNYNRQGHICLDLSDVGGKPLTDLKNSDTRIANPETRIACPELNTWRRRLEKSSVVGAPGEYKPLILDHKLRLYLYRYWEYQEKLAYLIKKRIHEKETDIEHGLPEQRLERLFPSAPNEEIDWQKMAAYTALTRKFCVISGGPGTGKTTTVAKIMALLIEQAEKKPRIALAAPTGKAAARLQEAIIRTKKNALPDCPDIIKEAIPEQASTIHRLLGSIPDSPYFRHNSENSLSADVVIVDEASMVDMALMSKLIQAIPIHARLILLGDKDQLASVEAGAVLGDICGTGIERYVRLTERIASDQLSLFNSEQQAEDSSHETFKTVRKCIVQLYRSYRFGGDSGIGEVSRSVNKGNADKGITLLKDGKYEDIQWKELPKPNHLLQYIKETVIRGFEDYLKNSGDPSEIFDKFDRFRILCAIRQGPYGVSALNRLAEQILRDKNLINPDKTWYAGRPVMITRNDYNLRLFNGDVGIALPDPDAENDIRVFFRNADGTPRKFHPFRLPEHETVYAMTVHKSQGSEFDKVLLLLPDRDSPVLTRELVYTGITRAMNSVEIWGVESVFRTAVLRRINRSSGLRDALWIDD